MTVQDRGSDGVSAARSIPPTAGLGVRHTKHPSGCSIGSALELLVCPRDGPEREAE